MVPCKRKCELVRFTLRFAFAKGVHCLVFYPGTLVDADFAGPIQILAAVGRYGELVVRGGRERNENRLRQQAGRIESKFAWTTVKRGGGYLHRI